MSGAGEYVIVWEFKVRQARKAEFVQKYGPEGAWARFSVVPQATFERSW